MDFCHLSDKLRPHITLPDSEDTWDRIAKALAALTQACEAREFTDPTEVVQSIRSFHSAIVHALNSERTRLCLAALDLVNTVAVACEATFEPLVSLLLPALLALCGRTNKVIVNRTRTCITHLVESTHLASLLAYFLPHLSEKSVTVRLIAVEAALTCIKCCNPPDLEKESRASDIENIIRKAARDASADVRKLGREVFTAYKILLPSRVDRFITPLTPTIRKYLDIKTTNATKPVTTTKVKSLSSLNATRPDGAGKPVIKHSRTASVTTSNSTTAMTKELHRPRPPSRGDSLMKSNPPQPVRPLAASRLLDSRSDHPRKLVSQTGATGPSRVISRPEPTEAPRPAVARPQRTLSAVAQRPLTRPQLSSTSQPLNVSGPRRVPLPPSSSRSPPQVADKLPTSRPESQQGRRIPVNALEKSSGTVGASRTARFEVKPAPVARSKTPVERPSKVRSGLTQPTLSQMAKMKSNVVRKPATNTKPAVKTVAITKAVVKTQPSDILREGAPRSNATVPAPTRQEPEEAARADEEIQRADVEEQLSEEPPHVESVEEEKEGEEIKAAVASNAPLPTITEPVPEVLHDQDRTHSASVSPTPEGPSADEGVLAQDQPITPPGQGHLNVAWSVNDAKTPISALLTSIQQGFEFSPASPLSPPQGYHEGHQLEALSLF